MKKLLKKVLFIICLICLANIGKAQVAAPPVGPSNYDTMMIYTPSQFVGYPMILDDLKYSWPDSSYWPFDPDNPCNCPDDYVYYTSWVDYAWQYTKLHLLRLKNRFCKTGDDTIPIPHAYGDRIISSRNGISTGFAQPYHLEDSAIIGGVALYTSRYFNSDDPYAHKVYMFDTNFNELANGYLYTYHMVINGIDYNYIDGGINNYYFNRKPDQTEYPKAKDFYLGFDVDGGIFTVNHTCRVDDDCLKYALPEYGYCYDTIFYGRVPNDGGSSSFTFGFEDREYVDTIPLCPYSGHPYFRDTNGVWKSFEEDSVLWIYRNIYIQAMPIILVPHATSSEIDINVEDYCQVYPNPTRTILKVLSNFNIWSIQLVDMNGREVYRQDNLNNFMDEINVESFPRGTYIVNIVTSKGRCSKKIIVN